MRHGRTDWNERNKLQGRTDIPLNAAGRKMAEEAAAVYKNVPLDVCYCSPLARARQTAEIFLKNRNIPIITYDRLVEMSFGIYEGTEQSARALDCPINILFKEPENRSGTITDSVDSTEINVVYYHPAYTHLFPY